MISAQQAAADFIAETCPSCGDPKKAKQSFCAGCYKLLPPHMQAALYQRFGAGYEMAYDQARRCIEQRRMTAKEVGAGRFTRVDYRKR